MVTGSVLGGRVGDGSPRPGEAPAGLAELVVHELASPLAIVASASEALQVRLETPDADRDEIERLVDMIDRNSRLAGLLLHRLWLAREGAEDVVGLARTRVNLGVLARETVSDLQHVALDGHVTRVSVEEPVVVTGDDAALRQVLFNLLSNAARYSHAATPIEVVISRDGDDAVVVVRNHGTGVAPEHAERIVERAFRVDVDAPGGGLGLGLFVSRSVARAHGGDLRLRPAAADGAEFELTLPLYRPSRSTA